MTTICSIITYRWILARKQNFPTKKNIQNKQKIIEEKIKKGVPVSMASISNTDNRDLSLLEKKLKK